MSKFKKNVLHNSSSPYLRLHKKNPVHWQEWNQDTVDYAQSKKLPLFVSVGYSTCHWCHVMEKEAFSDKKIAKYLNNHFVCIKVDREQRPDIDHYLLSFIQQTKGQGGWPLNVLLSPELKPFFAFTYAPKEAKDNMPSFLSIVGKAKEWYEKNNNSLQHYTPTLHQVSSVEGKEVIQSILAHFDTPGPKFPPHNTLLFLLHYYDNTKEQKVGSLLQNTLEKIALRGLHDHLQGGFFRYCVDTEWTIPHFEKMLYDQALMLWVYSIAYKVFRKEEYKIIVEILLQCLEESFEHHGMYYSAIDADTNFEEGSTYVWATEELQQILSQEEYQEFLRLYHITEKGNFNGKHHLIKKNADFLPDIEEKLLQIRNQRQQPNVDKKIITSWNCLTGIALLQAFRYVNNTLAKEQAIHLFKNILEKHYSGMTLVHSSFEDKLQEGEFLEDYASFLLFCTYIVEETGEHLDTLKMVYGQLKSFKEEHWNENKTEDFRAIPANIYDHPTPSSVSLAEFALYRADVLVNEKQTQKSFRTPLHFDFFNLLVYSQQGNVHLLYTPEHIDWEKLPLNVIQIKGDKIQHCYRKTCKKYDNVFDMVRELNPNVF